MKDKHAILIIISLASIFIFISNSDGLGLTKDSYYYLSQSQQLSRMGAIEYLMAYGWHQKLLIFVIYLLGGIKCTWLAIVNTVLWLATIWVWLKATRQLWPTFDWFFFGVMLACSTPMLMGVSFLWTESIFYLVIGMGYLVWQGDHLSKWVWAIPLIILLVFARKAGMIVILGIGFYELLLVRMPSYLKTLMVLVLGILIYIFYGNFGFPNMIGELPDKAYLFQNIQYDAQILGRWMSPWLHLPVGILVLLSFPFIYFFGLRKEAFMALIVIMTYIFVRWYYQREFLEEHERYLSVIWPFFWIVVIELLQKAQKFRFYLRAKAFAYALIFLYQLVRVTKNAILWSESGCMIS
ncbi:MAG: hypothetical protein JXR10_15115 [Cyclobacteriaceae bacterium]